VLARAPEQTLADLRRSLRRAVIAVNPARAEKAHQKASTERKVELWDAQTGWRRSARSSAPTTQRW
jgi:hypothetical protein